VRLKIHRGHMRAYVVKHGQEQKEEFECFLVVERENGRQMGIIHLWELTEKEAEELVGVKEIETK